MRLNDLPFPVYGDTGFRGKCPVESLEQITFFRRVRDAYPDSYGLTALHPRNEGLKIGGQFGNRDHTTVMYAERKINKLLSERRAVFNQVSELTNRVKMQARQA